MAGLTLAGEAAMHYTCVEVYPGRLLQEAAVVPGESLSDSGLSHKASYGTKIGPVLKCSQGLAAFRAGVAVEAQKNPPHAGRGGWREYWRLRCRAAQLGPKKEAPVGALCHETGGRL